MTNVTALNVDTLIGYNDNLRDIVTLENIDFIGGKSVCKLFLVKKDGGEPIFRHEKCQGVSIDKCVCN